MSQKMKVGSHEIVQLAVRVPQSLHRAARLQALAEERSLMDFVGEALAEHLARCQQPAPRRGSAEG